MGPTNVHFAIKVPYVRCIEKKKISHQLKLEGRVNVGKKKLLGVVFILFFKTRALTIVEPFWETLHYF